MACNDSALLTTDISACRLDGMARTLDCGLCDYSTQNSMYICLLDAGRLGAAAAAQAQPPRRLH